MLNKLRKMMTNQKGFTLVELMVVIAIIGVLSAIAIPKFTASTNVAKDGKLTADLRTLDSIMVQIYANTGSYPSDLKVAVEGKAATGTLGNANYVAATPSYLKELPTGADSAKTPITISSVDSTGYILTGTKSDGTTVTSPGSK